MTFTQDYLVETIESISTLRQSDVERLASNLAEVRDRGGRVFFVGCGGGAAHASHAVNDARKLCGIEAYSPTDNAAELTARVNDDGWVSAYSAWLRGCNIDNRDAVFVFSVGGGSKETGLSTNIIGAIHVAKNVGATVLGIVGRDGGETARVADACVIVPAPGNRVTPHTEGLQMVVWHLLVSHPAVKERAGVWEQRA